ncbi:unnamed protein product [Closterium sp. Naga37s-1]|nr:unnamed protein product [Closterium sp. Naga37s-1]
MAAQPAQPQEWAAVEQQPEVSRSVITSASDRLIEQARLGFPTINPADLSRFADFGKETVTVVAVGKGSVGKSATLNALLGERLFPTSGFQASAHLREAVRQYGGATLHVIDTPGLVDAGTVNRAALDAIMHALVGRTVDVLLYVERLDAYRVDTIDALVAQGISNAFGPQIWKRAVVVLTRAQLTPSDGRPFPDFVAARSDALLAMIRKQGRLGRNDEVPVALVESMEGRCRTNDDGDKILPDGRAWFPCLVEALVAVALRRQPVVRVDERMARGFNPNRAGKLLIPLLLALQVRASTHHPCTFLLAPPPPSPFNPNRAGKLLIPFLLALQVRAPPLPPPLHPALPPLHPPPPPFPVPSRPPPLLAPLPLLPPPLPSQPPPSSLTLPAFHPYPYFSPFPHLSPYPHLLPRALISHPTGIPHLPRCLTACVQVVLVALPLRRAMEWDKSEEKRHRPRWEEEAEDYRRSSAAAVARRRIAAFQQQQGKANPK